MKEWLQKTLRSLGEKGGRGAAAVVLLGVAGALLALSGPLFGSGGKPEKTAAQISGEPPPSKESAQGEAAELEARLSRTLSELDGAGEVRVMLTFRGVRTLTVAADQDSTRSRSLEADSAGGSRESEEEKASSKTVLLKTSDGEAPVILSQSEPEIEGVIIIAEGGGSIEVKAALSHAAGVALGLPANKVFVYKMKGK